MPEILHVMPTILRDVNVLRLKSQLINAVLPELQKLPPREQTRQIVRQWLDQALTRFNISIPAAARAHILESALADLVGYGPLELLLADPEISEIMVNGHKLVFVERHGVVMETDI